MRVLVVDDDKLIREMLNEALAMHEHQTRTAADGREALALMEESLPELVICDVQMPGMDGISLLQVMSERFPQVRVVMMTGGSGRASGPAFQYGAMGYLQKPIRIQEFLAGINRLAAQVGS